MQVVLAIMAGAGGLKLWLRAKNDVRSDGLGDLAKRSTESIAGTYSKLVLDLQVEVARLAEAVAAMSGELDVERTARRGAEALAVTAERRSVELTARVQHLEQVLVLHGIAF